MAQARQVVLSEQQRKELMQVRDHHHKAYMRVRASAILKVADGQSMSQVARHGLLKAMDYETISQWISRYEHDGLEGLQIQPGRGRKPVFSPVHESVETAAAELQGILHRSPRLYGLEYSQWTLERVRQVVAWLQTTPQGVPISRPGLCKLLKRCAVS